MHAILRTALVAAVLLPLVAFSGCSSNAKPRINGGGSSFVDVMMTKWTSIYEKEKGGQVNYQAIGSGGGIQKFMSQEFEFGCSDAPLDDKELTKAEKHGGAVHVPLTLGAVVLAYNLSEIDEPLQLTGPILADIFQRKITKWDDEQIKIINPTLATKLPAKDIVVIRRSDGSGTTHIFTDYLSKVSPDWKKSPGVGTSLNWHKDTTGAKGSAGVAGQVKLNPGSIGYVEMIYALQNQIKFAKVQNQEKEFILASLESTTTAADNSLKDIPDDLRFSITDAPGKGAYPICGTVWAILYAKQSGPKGKETVDFLRWVTREDGGQKHTKELHYAPLPKGLIERTEKALAKVKVD